MKAADPLIISWQGRQLRVRHDDPHLGPYTPRGATLRAAVELASDVERLRLVLASTLGDRYRIKVSEDGTTVGLWRRRQMTSLAPLPRPSTDGPVPLAELR